MYLSLESIKEQLDLLMSDNDLKVGTVVVNILSPEKKIDSLCFLLKEVIEQLIQIRDTIYLQQIGMGDEE